MPPYASVRVWPQTLAARRSDVLDIPGCHDVFCPIGRDPQPALGVDPRGNTTERAAVRRRDGHVLLQSGAPVVVVGGQAAGPGVTARVAPAGVLAAELDQHRGEQRASIDRG